MLGVLPSLSPDHLGCGLGATLLLYLWFQPHRSITAHALCLSNLGQEPLNTLFSSEESFFCLIMCCRFNGRKVQCGVGLGGRTDGAWLQVLNWAAGWAMLTTDPWERAQGTWCRGCVCVSVSVCVYELMCVCKCVYECMYVYKCLLVCVCLRVCMCPQVHVCL